MVKELKKTDKSAKKTVSSSKKSVARSASKVAIKSKMRDMPKPNPSKPVVLKKNRGAVTAKPSLPAAKKSVKKIVASKTNVKKVIKPTETAAKKMGEVKVSSAIMSQKKGSTSTPLKRPISRPKFEDREKPLPKRLSSNSMKVKIQTAEGWKRSMRRKVGLKGVAAGKGS